MKKQQAEPLNSVDLPLGFAAPAGLAAAYLRSFAMSLDSFGEFDRFLEELRRLVGKDQYLNGSAQLCDLLSAACEQPDFETLREDEIVIAVSGVEGNSGYLKYAGRADGHPFGAEDLHLMGAISSVVSALVSQAQNFRKKEQASSILQYLINQLPLGVVCFDGGGNLLNENKVAQRLLGEGGSELIQAQLTSAGKVQGERVRLHFEVDGKLIYSEGRSLEVAAGIVIDAYVLYDLSGSREKLLKDLELEAYMSESRGGAVVVALLESRAIAGDIYKKVKAAAADFELEPAKIQPLDAYSCACIFKGKALRSVRYLLKHRLPLQKLEGLRLSVVAYDSNKSSVEPAQELIATAYSELAQSDSALLPELLVLANYPPVVDALDMIVADECRLRTANSLDEAEALIRSGRVDGLILDVDGYDKAVLIRMQAASDMAGSGFKVFYSSYKQPQMARAEHDLPKGACLLQKPFDAATVVDAVTLQFNLA